MTNIDRARKLIAEFPDTPSLTLAKRLYRENKECFANQEAARSSIRVARGNIGSAARKSTRATHPRANGKAGWVAECPPSKAEPWLPFDLGAGIRVLSLSDIHVPYHDAEALTKAVAWGRKWKPDVLLINGDVCDFYAVSRWDKDPKKRNFPAELGVCVDVLRWLRSNFPKARMVLKLGNHEERYDKYIWNKAPELWGLPQCQIDSILQLADYGCEMVTDQRPILAGILPIWHGHELPRGLASPVNQARGAFLRMLDTSLTAHGHRTSTHSETNWKHQVVTCWSQGCLCDRSPEYAKINKWDLGFCAIDVDADGRFNVTNLKLIDGEYRLS